MQHSILYNDEELKFEVKVNKLAKRIILKVTDDGEVSVTVPRRGLEREAIRFAKKRARWIYLHLSKIKSEKERRQPIIDKVLFLGNSYPIELFENSALKLDFKENKFELHLSNHTYEDIRSELKKWYVQQAKRIIPDLVQDSRVERITIRGQKTCWGSCSAKKNLNFNWRLMMAPPEVVRYVVVHELTHLEHMNHSAQFWKAVSEKCPEFRRHKAWLRMNGKLLKF